MRENNGERQCDRSYFCLVAIYAIHAILLNVVFLQPKLNYHEDRVGLSMNKVIDNDDERLSSKYDVKNASEIVSTSYEMKNHHFETSRDRFNFTDRSNFTERKIIVVVENDVDVYSDDSSTDPLFQQSKSGGSAINFLTVAKTLGISRLSKNIMEIGKSMIEELSPAAIGIIAGCLVFLLTFTENDYV